MLSRRCHYCGKVAHTGAVRPAMRRRVARALRAAAAAGIAVCHEHRELVLVDPVHHPYMRRWEGSEDASVS